MNFEEYAAKPLLAAAGIATPKGIVAVTPDEAADAVRETGACVVKAQVPTGKRGKAGGIKAAASPEEARTAAEAVRKTARIITLGRGKRTIYGAVYAAYAENALAAALTVYP